jgi:hypothetical protein
MSASSHTSPTLVDFVSPTSARPFDNVPSTLDDSPSTREVAMDRLIVQLFRDGDIESGAALFFDEYRDMIVLLNLPPHQRKRVLLDSVGLLNLAKVNLAVLPHLPSLLAVPDDSRCGKLMRDADAFFATTRVTPTEYLIILNDVGTHILNRRGNPTPDTLQQSLLKSHRLLPPCDELLLWMHHGDGVGDELLGDYFDINRRTVSQYADHVTECINSALKMETAWPTAEMRRDLYGFFSLRKEAELFNMCERARFDYFH